MDKKEIKTIKITDVIVNKLGSSSDVCGEYYTHVDVDFILDTPQLITVFNREYIIDRVKMYDVWGDTIALALASDTEIFESFEVSKIFIHKIYLMLGDLKRGILKGYDFQEDVFMLLSDDD